MSGLQIIQSNNYQSPPSQEILTAKNQINSGLQQNTLNKSIVIDREIPSSSNYPHDELPIERVNFQAKILPQSKIISGNSGILAANLSNPVQSIFPKQQVSFPMTETNLIPSYLKYPYPSSLSNYEENPNKENQYSYNYPTSTDRYQNLTYLDNGYKSSVRPTTYIPASSTRTSQYLQQEIVRPPASNYYESSFLQTKFVEPEKSSSYPTKSSTTFVKPGDTTYTTSYTIQTPVQYITIPSTATTEYPSLSQYIMPQYMPSQSSHQYTSSASYEQPIRYPPPIQTNLSTNFPAQQQFSPRSISATSMYNNPLWGPKTSNYVAEPPQNESNLILKPLNRTSNILDLPLESERYSKDYFSTTTDPLKLAKSPRKPTNLHVFNNAVRALTPSRESLTNRWVDEKYEDGSFYLGEKFENIKNGRGFFTYPDGTKFDGEFEDDIISGYGKLFDKDNKLIYDGEWKNSMYHGNGTLYNTQIEGESEILKSKEKIGEELISEEERKKQEKQAQSGGLLIETKKEAENIIENVKEIIKSVVNAVVGDDEEEKNSLNDMEMQGLNWIRYDGEFYQGKKHGLGTLFLKGGRKFTGMFCNDMIQGIGTFYFEDGQTLIGEWENDELITEL